MIEPVRCVCGSRRYWTLYDLHLYAIECRDCGKSGPSAVDEVGAIEKWNATMDKAEPRNPYYGSMQGPYNV
jgi:hypothetical protein